MDGVGSKQSVGSFDGVQTRPVFPPTLWRGSHSRFPLGRLIETVIVCASEAEPARRSWQACRLHFGPFAPNGLARRPAARAPPLGGGALCPDLSKTTSLGATNTLRFQRMIDNTLVAIVARGVPPGLLRARVPRPVWGSARVVRRGRVQGPLGNRHQSTAKSGRKTQSIGWARRRDFLKVQPDGVGGVGASGRSGRGNGRKGYTRTQRQASTRTQGRTDRLQFGNMVYLVQTGFCAKHGSGFLS